MNIPMHSTFPRLSPPMFTKDPKEFEGFISIKGKDYYIYLETPNFPESKNIVMKPEIQLSAMINDSGFRRMEIPESSTVFQFLKLLQDTCEKYVEESSTLQTLDFTLAQHSQLSLLLSHIEELGWERIAHIAPDFSFIDLQYKDASGRIHNIHVKITSKYSIQPPSVEVDLPTEVKFCNGQNKTLASIYGNFESYSNSLQPFWKIMDDLDETALVIDPSNPLRKHITRRILLENQVSIHLVVSPDRPFEPPKFQFLGPSSLVAPLNEKLLELHEKWDSSESIVYNLEHILKERVVKRVSQNRGTEEEAIFDELNVECAVCYSLHLDDHLPDFTCDSCQKNFHLLCLYDWLRSLPSSIQSRQFIRGDCPYCTKTVSCKVPA